MAIGVISSVDTSSRSGRAAASATGSPRSAACIGAGDSLRNSMRGLKRSADSAVLEEGDASVAMPNARPPPARIQAPNGYKGSRKKRDQELPAQAVQQRLHRARLGRAAQRVQLQAARGPGFV